MNNEPEAVIVRLKDKLAALKDKLAAREEALRSVQPAISEAVTWLDILLHAPHQPEPFTLSAEEEDEAGIALGNLRGALATCSRGLRRLRPSDENKCDG